MDTTYSWEIKKTDDKGTRVITKGDGFEKETAAILRSVADTLDPPAQALRSLFGG